MVFTLRPDLTIHRVYDGYWFWGRPTNEELRQDFRATATRSARLGAPQAVSWLWFDLCPGTVTDALASAVAYNEHDRGIGTLAAWRQNALRPSPSAAKIDERVIDPTRAAGWVSWALGSGGLFLPFDDPAVAQATRMVLSMAPRRRLLHPGAWRRSLRRGADRSYDSPGELAYDPFANLFPTVVLRVEAGILGRMPAPLGPVTPALRGGQPLALGPVLAESTERDSR